MDAKLEKQIKFYTVLRDVVAGISLALGVWLAISYYDMGFTLSAAMKLIYYIMLALIVALPIAPTWKETPRWQKLIRLGLILIAIGIILWDYELMINR